MGAKSYLGEFEHMVLLAILQLGDAAYGPHVSALLEERVGREVSRGALYSSLNRLESKGMLAWTPEAPDADRGGQPMRLFSVTDLGMEALRANREALLTLWKGLERTLAGKQSV